MANNLARRLLRRGLELFALISVLGFGAMLLYGNNLQQFLQTMVSLKWGWLLAGVLLASHDWWGGGLRAWVMARHVYPKAPLKGCVLAGGMATWAAYLTPSQTGAGPMLIYTMNRSGIPLPEAMIAALMTFVATVLFFTVAGPLAVFLGAGQSLAQHGVLGQAVTLNDLFRLSLGGFIGVGFVILLLISFPGLARRIARRLVSRLKRRGSEKLASRVVHLEDGIDRAHGALKAFTRGRGWIALAIGVVLTGAAQANRLLAGYVVLRMLDIHAPFVDVLLLQTLIVFLLYFAPTPGGSGLAELLSAAVMSIYVPRELTPSYILLWRIVVSYLTVGTGSFVFWKWLKGAESGAANSLQQQEIPEETRE
jgi:uncharacterized protein (TIRG00374 family)